MFEYTEHFSVRFCSCHDATRFLKLLWGISSIITEVTLIAYNGVFLVTNDFILHHVILCQLCTF